MPAVFSPPRRIEITTVDKCSYLLEEFHEFSTLTKTYDGKTEVFDNVEIEYQDLLPGLPLSWVEIVFDGSVLTHDAPAIVSVNIV
jgi:hypothetical protein